MNFILTIGCIYFPTKANLLPGKSIVIAIHSKRIKYLMPKRMKSIYKQSKQFLRVCHTMHVSLFVSFTFISHDSKKSHTFDFYLLSHFLFFFFFLINMSAYKALTKKNSEDKRINKQRVMMLCSRGVTYR